MFANYAYCILLTPESLKGIFFHYYLFIYYRMALRKYTYFTTDITELGVLIYHTYLCFYSSCDFNTKMENHCVIKMTFAGKGLLDTQETPTF